MLKTIKKYAAAFALAALILSPAFSQELDSDSEDELTPEELLELENAEENQKAEKDRLPQELQQNFIIVEPVRIHELNPQITNYSSDSQILNGLFEGLFTISPVSLEPQYAIAKEFKISRDKKRWTITLRDDAFFSNGEKITAENVRSIRPSTGLKPKYYPDILDKTAKVDIPFGTPISFEILQEN